MTEKQLLEVKDLQTYFHTDYGFAKAVDGVSFNIEEGEIVGLVGESGSGKSVTAESILRLLDEDSLKYSGEINFNGDNILKLSKSKMRKIRGNDISMIFQDPSSALNPVHTIGKQIVESILIHQKTSVKKARLKAINLLRLTGIPSPETRVNEYPHELSGGMRQRAMIAITLACEPKLLIADEPTTALDVTIQAQILNLIEELNKEQKMGVIFITHDLGVVAEICHRVMVMYLGQIVEEVSVETLFKKPLHPYTKGLINSIPPIDGERSNMLPTIKGSVPSLKDRPEGCRFSNRCPYADELCVSKNPELEIVSDSQKVRCWHYEKIALKEGGTVATT